MSEFVRVAKKLVPAIALGVAACTATEQPSSTPITPGNAPAALKEAYISCELGDTYNDYRLKGTDSRKGKGGEIEQLVIFQFPLTVKKNPDVFAKSVDQKIAYRGVIAQEESKGGPALFGDPADVGYDEQRGLVRHTIPRGLLKSGNVTLKYSVRAEEIADGPHRAIDLECGDLVIDVRGRGTIEPTTHTARGGIPEVTEVIIQTPSTP